MSSIRLRRPSPALVVAIIALIIAVAGTSYAAFSLPRNSVGTKQLRNGAVATGKLRNGAVTNRKIGNGAVTKAKLNVEGVTVPSALHADTAGTATNPYARAQKLQPTSAFLENGWTTGPGFGVAGYAKDQFGIVHLFGAVSIAPTTTNRIFTLPAGFRPGYNVEVAAAFPSHNVGVLQIHPDGTVNPLATTTFVDLEGITFSAGG
ncbi:MAG: hypothetical protein QOD66_2012 [Solirubrobacteraceae bacterium]|nr:hypothetical protein [Solirubrobacteraceae bacterium]